MPPRPGHGTELTTRSDAADLPPRTDASKPVPLLTAEAELDTWRIVEVFSRTLLPFEVELSWSAGSGSGAVARVTVARSARICLFARSLRVAAANLATVANRVGITIGDGFAVTENQLEVVGGAGEGPLEVPIPPFARRARLDLADGAALPGSRVRLVDGLGAVRAAVTASEQPPDGLWLGGAGSLQVEPAAGVDWRVVFTLSL